MIVLVGGAETELDRLAVETELGRGSAGAVGVVVSDDDWQSRLASLSTAIGSVGERVFWGVLDMLMMSRLSLRPSREIVIGVELDGVGERMPLLRVLETALVFTVLW